MKEDLNVQLRGSWRGQLQSPPQLFQKGRSPVWKNLLRSPPIPMLCLALSLQTGVWLRDRHMYVRGGRKVSWISLRKAHWWCFVASYEHECNVSRSCWKETIAQTIYWRSRPSWKISMVCNPPPKKGKSKLRIRASLTERYRARGLPI